MSRPVGRVLSPSLSVTCQHPPPRHLTCSFTSRRFLSVLTSFRPLGGTETELAVQGLGRRLDSGDSHGELVTDKGEASQSPKQAMDEEIGS